MNAKFLTSIMKWVIAFSFIVCGNIGVKAQLHWKQVDTAFAPLPKKFHVFTSVDSLNGKPFRAFYALVPLGSRSIMLKTDTTSKRSFTPTQFFKKNKEPLLVVNGTFFNFQQHKNLNLLINRGKLLSDNFSTHAGKGPDTMLYRHVFPSAIIFNKKQQANIGWTYTNGSKLWWIDEPEDAKIITDSVAQFPLPKLEKKGNAMKKRMAYTAIGGGPVLLQKGQLLITNNEEMKFSGKAKEDLHPRTAMGYTADGNLVVLVIEGRNPAAAGVSLTQLATILQGLGCIEALNLDGGGSSCMLINGKETIRPSDKTGQRPVPGVFIISH